MNKWQVWQWLWLNYLSQYKGLEIPNIINSENYNVIKFFHLSFLQFSLFWCLSFKWLKQLPTIISSHWNTQQKNTNIFLTLLPKGKKNLSSTPNRLSHILHNITYTLLTQPLKTRGLNYLDWFPLHVILPWNIKHPDT